MFLSAPFYMFQIVMIIKMIFHMQKTNSRCVERIRRPFEVKNSLNVSKDTFYGVTNGEG